MHIDLSQPILVVEDSTTMSQIMRAILRQIGFRNVDQVQNGNEALTKLRAGNYSIIISDWNMESMSGYDLLKEVRADEKLAHIRFIMVSAEPSIAHVVATKKAKANCYLMKPFNAEALRAKIEEALQAPTGAVAQ